MTFPQVTVSATVRYNVVATDATVEGGDILNVAARFRDAGELKYFPDFYIS